MAEQANGQVSRRTVLKRGAAAAGGAAAGLLGGREVLAQAPAVATGAQAGRPFRAWVQQDAQVGVEDLRLLPLQPRQVLIRTEASALRQAWEFTRRGGEIVYLGFGQPGEVSYPATAFANRGRTVHAGQQGGLNMMRDLPRFIRLVEKGEFDLASMVTSTCTTSGLKPPRYEPPRYEALATSPSLRATYTRSAAYRKNAGAHVARPRVASGRAG